MFDFVSWTSRVGQQLGAPPVQGAGTGWFVDAVGALDRSGLDDFLVGVGDELSLGITEGV